MERFLFTLMLKELKQNQNGFQHDIHKAAQMVISNRDIVTDSESSDSEGFGNGITIYRPTNIEDLPSELLCHCASYLRLQDSVAIKQSTRYLSKCVQITLLTNPNWLKRYKINYGESMAIHQWKRLDLRNIRSLSLNHSDFDSIDPYSFADDKPALYSLCLKDLHIFIEHTSTPDYEHMLDVLVESTLNQNVTHLTVTRTKTSKSCISMQSLPQFLCVSPDLQSLKLERFTIFEWERHLLSNWDFEGLEYLTELHRIHFVQCHDQICAEIMNHLGTHKLQSLETDSYVFHGPFKQNIDESLEELTLPFYDDASFCRRVLGYQRLKRLKFTNNEVYFEGDNLFEHLIEALEDRAFEGDFVLDLPYATRLEHIDQAGLRMAAILDSNVDGDFVLILRLLTYKRLNGAEMVEKLRRITEALSETCDVRIYRKGSRRGAAEIAQFAVFNKGNSELQYAESILFEPQ